MLLKPSSSSGERIHMAIEAMTAKKDWSGSPPPGPAPRHLCGCARSAAGVGGAPARRGTLAAGRGVKNTLGDLTGKGESRGQRAGSGAEWMVAAVGDSDRWKQPYVPHPYCGTAQMTAAAKAGWGGSAN